MPITKTQFDTFIRNFDLRNLFNEMGWDNDRTEHHVSVDGVNYLVKAVAEKAGFKVLQLETKKVPDYAVRRKIEFAVGKYFEEHLLIFTDQSQQCWQLAVRESQKQITIRETRWFTHQAPELLYQKLQNVTFDLDEQDNITVIDVKHRLTENFTANAEKVTKKFYEAFKKEHDAFEKFITGIDEINDKNWYTSVMLNRLMFVYFLQKKGFLDGNIHYLRDKLAAYKNFHNTFYKDFLLAFFHQGLGQRTHSAELIKKLGKIPYLNGGFFDVHSLETKHSKINIPDKAFENIFNFFDQWEWHLDTRSTAKGNEVNPDVVGYIFEKYINQKQMGAYYTKEDITEYISKNVIIPFLFDKAGIDETNSCWQLLQENPDRYIYPSVLKGVGDILPEEIACGLDSECDYATLKERRKHWNKAAAPNVALPTETWREHIARRNRCLDVRQKLQSGKVKSINALITYNLNIQQFAFDTVGTSDESLLKRFLDALRNVKILDPTCGSGAFLFAALNILEPLYKICTERIAERLPAESLPAEPLQSRNRKIAQEKDEQSRNRKIAQNKYSIYKQIILNNLYGVDIMEEAVEICKLRLFLKLAAEIDDASQIEPLPDIDFNIRCGNTLVGYATMTQLEESMKGKLPLESETLERKAQRLSEIYEKFILLQAEGHFSGGSGQAVKQEYRCALDELNDELDRYLAFSMYGITEIKDQLVSWRRSHRPFHWLIEFYGIMHNGGFDCVIGNPPYVETLTKDSPYKNFQTLSAANLHALCTERSRQLLRKDFYRIGLILPIGAFSTIGMKPLMDFIEHNFGMIWTSFYHFRPSPLFNGANIATNIFIASNGDNARYTTGLYKFSDETRCDLFDMLQYVHDTSELRTMMNYCFPKVSHPIELDIIHKVFSSEKPLIGLRSKTQTKQFISYRTAGGLYFKIILNFPFPYESTSNKTSYFLDHVDHNVITAFLNSSLQWLFYTEVFDSLNFKDYYIFSLPFSYDTLSEEHKKELHNLCDDLMADYKKNAKHKHRGKTPCYEITANLSKPIIDRIDEVLGEHYGFTSEELDFIINYDIKYRLGGAEEKRD